ncbi:MAG: hypothetical protein WBH97_06295 [Rectinemataceae bacterium]
MKVLRHSAFFAIFALLLFCATGAIGAQSSGSKSVSIQLVGVVPPRLDMNLTFAPGNAVTLEGRGAEERSGNGTFTVASGAEVELGYANIFSNLMGSFSIVVWSDNGGSLRDPAGTDGTAVPYNLTFGDQSASASGGAFRFASSGKTSKSGTSTRVSLGFGVVPEAAKNSVLTDRLVFSLSAN